MIISRWLPVIIWVGIIYYLSDQPNLKISHNSLIDLVLRKGAHMFFFGVLYILVVRAFGWTNNKWAIIVAVAYAIFDEIHQKFVPFRTGQPKDILFDVTGVALAHLALWKLQPYLKSKLER